MKNVRRDINLISSCSIPYVLNVKMQTKTMHCSCPRVYVRGYPPKKTRNKNIYIAVFEIQLHDKVVKDKIQSLKDKKKKQENIQICNSNTS